MRKKTLHRLQAAAALGAFAAGGIAVQQLRRHARHGWGHSTPYGKRFDPARMETIQGKVVRVARFVPVPGMSEGIELLLETAEGRVAVHLGPSKFVSFDETGVDPGDTIEVSGSRIDLAGETVLLATVIRKGELQIVLRNERGVPVWHRTRH
jgi:hypothetical protein